MLTPFKLSLIKKKKRDYSRGYCKSFDIKKRLSNFTNSLLLIEVFINCV